MASDNIKHLVRGSHNKPGYFLKAKPHETIAETAEYNLKKLKNNNIEILRELVSVRHKAETALGNYNELYSVAPTAFFTLSPKGKIIKLNHQAELLLQKKEDKILNSNFDTYVSDKSKVDFHNFLQLIFKNSVKESCELTLGTKTTSPQIVSASGLILENASGCIISIQDISHLKKMEGELKESENSFNRTQQIAHVGSWKWYIKKNRLEWSDEMYRIFGISKENFSGNLIEVINQSIHPDDRASVEQSNLSVILNKKPVPLEYRIVWPNEAVRTVWAEAGELILDAKGKAAILTGIVKDITERKNIEDEFKDAHNLLKMLYVRQDEIRENERTAISREIHDELGQFLTALKFDLNWVKDNADTKENATAKINGMIDIVNDSIKTVQRISSELRPGLLDDLGLVPAMEWYCQEFEKRAGIKCYFKSSVTELNDPKKSLALYRILQETLTNILRHSQANAVIVKLNKQVGRTILEINDNGIGIPQEKINSPKSLGLIGIKERVKHYGGFLSIHSFKNKGTNILITIPAD